MSISTFNFQFYNYKLPVEMPQFVTASSFSELEMDIDDEEKELSTPATTSTPLPAVKQPTVMTTPRYTSEVSLDIGAKPETEALRPQLRCPQKRWSMELREKVLEMSKRSNAADAEAQTTNLQQRFVQQLAESTPELPEATTETETSCTVSDKINFFNKLTNTYESARNSNANNNNRFISLLRFTRPMGVATTSSGMAVSPVPPPKPKRLIASSTTTTTSNVPHQFATPTAKPPFSNNNNTNSAQRKSSLRRKPSMEKSRATIARQNSTATLRPQRHAIMEDLSLVVPVRLRIAEYEQRISLNA